MTNPTKIYVAQSVLQTFSRLEHGFQRFGRVLIIGAVVESHSLSAHVVGIRLDVARRLDVILPAQGLDRIHTGLKYEGEKLKISMF